jgi:hypothetical protein
MGIDTKSVEEFGAELAKALGGHRVEPFQTPVISFTVDGVDYIADARTPKNRQWDIYPAFDGGRMAYAGAIPGIKVSISRNPDRIAAEIRRRLAERARAWVEGCRKAFADAHQDYIEQLAAAARLELAARAAGLTPSAWKPNKGSPIRMYLSGGGGTASVLVDVGGRFHFDRHPTWRDPEAFAAAIASSLEGGD